MSSLLQLRDGIGVTTVVAQIVSAYRDGAIIIDNVKRKRAAGGGTSIPIELEKIIKETPDDIEREKRRGLKEFGEAFNQGDAIAIITLQREAIQAQYNLLEKLRKAYDSDADLTVVAEEAKRGRNEAIRAMVELQKRLDASLIAVTHTQEESVQDIDPYASHLSQEDHKKQPSKDTGVAESTKRGQREHRFNLYHLSSEQTATPDHDFDDRSAPSTAYNLSGLSKQSTAKKDSGADASSIAAPFEPHVQERAALAGFTDIAPPTATGNKSGSTSGMTGLNEARIELQPDMVDLEAILNPMQYYQSLDDIETKIINTSRLAESLSIDSTYSRRLNIKRSHDYKLTSDMVKEVAGYGLEVLNILRTENLCDKCIHVLMDDTTRDSVIMTVQIRINDISQALQDIQDASSGESWDSTTISSIFDHLSLRNYPSRIEKRHLTLCYFLILAMVSFAGSHCSPLDSLSASNLFDAIALNGLHLVSDTGSTPLVFQKRRLRCLHEYIGSPVWIFGRASPQQPAILSISVKQFADLWGPMQAVPVEKGSQEVVAFRLESGLMYQVSPSKKGQSVALHSQEVIMHFSEVKHLGRTVLANGKLSEHTTYRFSNDEELPETMIPFPLTAQLLIGHPADGQPTPQSAQSTSETRQHLLTENSRCTVDVDRFQREHTHLFYPLDTYNAHYVSDQFQASLAVTQHVGGGVAKVWKKRPKSTWKEQLSLYCSTCPRNSVHFWSVLQLRIGLEYSICSGNARRTTLWEALNLAYSTAVDHLRAARDALDLSALSDYIKQLSRTGYNERERFQLFWPFDHGYPYILDLTDHVPGWSSILKDTRTSACFATMSSSCLIHHDKDVYARPHRKLEQACHGMVAAYPNAFLETTINLHPESRPTLPLRTGSCVRLQEGFLEMRNTTLAFYENNSLWNRLEEMQACASDGRKRHEHHELLDTQRASNYVMIVCIRDHSKNGSRSEDKPVSVPHLCTCRDPNEELGVTYVLRAANVVDGERIRPPDRAQYNSGPTEARVPGVQNQRMDRS